MEIYHHSKYENLAKIIKREGLSFRGSYYEEFSDADYKWTKRVVSRIIKRICINRNAYYDEDSSFNPIIISFGKEPYSRYMWERYARQYTGIQFVLDYDIIQQYAYDKLDYFTNCKYMRKRDRMKRFIEQFSHSVESIDDVQYNLEAVSVLIKPVRFRKEHEFRYTHAYSKLLSVRYKDYVVKGDDAFEKCMPKVDDDERFVCFPKETLLGIRIGYKSSSRLDEVKKLLTECGYDLSKVNVEVFNPI